ncbi:hypothetical protein GCM10027517_08320 [Phycicoccus ginsengisoli]
MAASHPRTSAGERRAGASTARGDEGTSHRVATETATHAGCPARTGYAVEGRGVVGRVVVAPGPDEVGVDVRPVAVDVGGTVVTGPGVRTGPPVAVAEALDSEVGPVATGGVVAHPDAASSTVLAAATTSLPRMPVRGPGAGSTTSPCRPARRGGSAGGPRSRRGGGTSRAGVTGRAGGAAAGWRCRGASRASTAPRRQPVPSSW